MAMEFSERFENFITAITKTYKTIQKIKLSEAERIGLKGNQVMYMYYLGKNQEGLTPIELSKLCVEDKSAVSRAIVELTNRGFVESYADNSKQKYRMKIVLTEQGRSINTQINKAIAIAVDKASKDLTESERENFYNVFYQISGNLEDMNSSYSEK